MVKVDEHKFSYFFISIYYVHIQKLSYNVCFFRQSYTVFHVSKKYDVKVTKKNIMLNSSVSL